MNIKIFLTVYWIEFYFFYLNFKKLIKYKNECVWKSEYKLILSLNNGAIDNIVVDDLFIICETVYILGIIVDNYVKIDKTVRYRIIEEEDIFVKNNDYIC